MALSTPHFDRMFEQPDDPWKFRSRWYEARKRDVTLACLPAARFERAYEPSCANGELTVMLAPRCENLLASDCADRAVAIARTRPAGFSNVEVTQAQTPSGWPQRSFDLIVISELAYFLEAAELLDLTARIGASLGEGGTVLACHWRPRIEGCDFDGDEVHRRLDAGLQLPKLMQEVDDDFRIDVWRRDGHSVASQEHLR